MTANTCRLLILGVGNTLLGDEGLGIACLHALQDAMATQPSAVLAPTWMDGGTLSFTLAPAIADHDALLVLDAAELGGAPGDIHVAEGEAMDAFIGSHRKRSVHEVGLVDLMSISLLSGHWPARRALVGMQPQLIAWSDRMSTPVAAAMPAMVAQAIACILRWESAAMG